MAMSAIALRLSLNKEPARRQIRTDLDTVHFILVRQAQVAAFVICLTDNDIDQGLGTSITESQLPTPAPLVKPSVASTSSSA